MHKSFLSIFAITLIISGCQTQPDQTASTPKTVLNKDSVANKTTDSLILKHEPCENDSLNAIANVMSGIVDSSMVYKDVQHSSSFQTFSSNFNKRWMSFDSSRLTTLNSFRENEI